MRSRVEICRPGRWLLPAVVLIAAIALPVAAQEDVKPADTAPEQAQPNPASMNRPLVWTGAGERGLSQTFPDAAVWLELEEGERALGLFYPETRLPARGAVVVLADQGETAASGLAGAVARALAARGWAVLTLGLEAPSPVLERILAGRSAAPDPESSGEAGAESVMIDVMKSEIPEDLEARYRSRISQALAAGLAELVGRGYESPVLLGIGRAGIHVTDRVLEGANASAVIWVAPRFYPADHKELPERLASLGTPLLHLHPSGPDGGNPGWSTGDRLLRAGVPGYQQQPVPWFSPPSEALGDTIAGRAAAWLEAR